MRILTINPNARRDCSYHGGPSVFLNKLIKSAHKQKLAEFVFNSEDVDAVLCLIASPHINIVKRIKARNKPIVLRLDSLYQSTQRLPVIKNMFDTADHIIYQNNYCKECVEKLAGVKDCSVIFNGDDVIRFNGTEQSYNLPGFTFVSISKWRTWKKLALSVRCIKALIDEGHDVSFLIGGNCDEMNITIEDKYKDRIVKAGHIVQDLVPAFYNSGKAVLHPDKGDSCPNVVVEGVIAGLPCIVHGHGGAKEIIGDSGIALLEYNIQDYKNKMKDIINNYDMYKAKVLARRGLFDIDIISRKYIAVVQRLISAKKKV